MSFAYQRRSRYTVTVPTRQLLAAGMTLIAMWTFYWASNGLAGIGDWSAYRLMYDSGGDYLSRNGRDPGFVWLISAAAWAFGYDGYETFRTVLFSIFTLVAARWAYLARGLTPVTALTIFATLIVKSTVQIREGVAFVLLAWPLIGLYVQRPKGVVRRPRTAFAALVGAVLASLTHFGTSIFLGVWLGAAFLTLIPRKFLAWSYTPRALLLLGLGFGLSLGGVIVAFPQPFESLAVDLAGGVYSTPQTFLLKTLYWLTLGLLTFGVGHQLVKAAQGCSAFGYAYAVVLGRFALPLICSACIFLVVSAFSIIQITEWGNRLLASLLELALILITVRGRANYLTLLMALILLANAARSFVTYWGLAPPV
jgi:hypothetical protein